jgi:hypothetical protein
LLFDLRLLVLHSVAELEEAVAKTNEFLDSPAKVLAGSKPNPRRTVSAAWLETSEDSPADVRAPPTKILAATPADRPGELFVDVRRDFLAKLDKGTTCPLCEGRAQRYTRSVHSNLAGFLLYLHKTSGVEWVDAVKLSLEYYRRLVKKKPGAKRCGDYSTARYWGLIEQAPKENRAARGFWRLTRRGERFVLGEISVPRQCVEYKSSPIRFSVERTTLAEALEGGKWFDFWETVGDASEIKGGDSVEA